MHFPNANYDYDVKTKVATPARYRVKLPKGYDGNRKEPYDALICVPGEAGFGPREGKVSLTSSVAKKKWNDAKDVILVELAFNTPTWLNDSASMNHESYLLKVVLPHFLAAHNVGKMSLLGFGSGAYGALSLLMRRPTAFHAVIAADVPILGGFKMIERAWGREDLEREANWGSWNEAFPQDDDWTPYDVTTIARDAWVRDHLNATELSRIARQLEAAGVAHDVIEGFESVDIHHEGEWIDAALGWLAPRLA